MVDIMFFRFDFSLKPSNEILNLKKIDIDYAILIFFLNFCKIICGFGIILKKKRQSNIYIYIYIYLSCLFNLKSKFEFKLPLLFFLGRIYLAS